MKTKKVKKVKLEVKRVFTLSKYNWGQHHFQQNGEGIPSFAESLCDINRMINRLYGMGTPLGSNIEVTMKVKKVRK